MFDNIDILLTIKLIKTNKSWYGEENGDGCTQFKRNDKSYLLLNDSGRRFNVRKLRKT